MVHDALSRHACTKEVGAVRGGAASAIVTRCVLDCGAHDRAQLAEVVRGQREAAVFSRCGGARWGVSAALVHVVRAAEVAAGCERSAGVFESDATRG